MAKSGLKQGEGTIVERPSGAYQTRWVEHNDRDGSVTRRARSFATREQAEDFLRQQYRKRRSGAYVAPERTTVAQLIAAWIERGSHSWKPNTTYTYTYNATTHIYPYLGEIRVPELTPPRIQHWVDTLVRRGLSPSYIRGARSVLAGAYREAVRLGVLPSSPVVGVRLPPLKPKPIKTWTEDDVRRVIDALDGKPKWLALYHVATISGMRPGELRSLRWGDLDIERRVILVQRTVTRTAEGSEIVGEETKTGKRRTVALSARAMAALLAWRTEQKRVRIAAPLWIDGDYIFTNDDGTYLSDDHWATAHAQVCAAAQVRLISKHQIRHSNATIDLDAGTPLKIVSERLGHARPEFTARIYQHPSDETQQAATDALDERLFGATKEA